MCRAAAELHACVQPTLVCHRSGKAHARLEHNQSLLGIDRDRPARSRQGPPLIEQLPDNRRAVSEVVGEPVVATRVPEVAAREPMAASVASPECH